MLSLVAALLVILITAFWAFQGLFSSVIMLCEAVLALMTAFTFYEPLAQYWKDSLSPENSEAGFLFVIFLVTLIVMRFLSDKFIPGTIRAHVIVDRVGGGICGLFTALILVGVMLICVQMLPVGGTTFGFVRINPANRRVNNIWMNADGFTIGLVNMLSNDRFAWDAGRLDVAKPDMLTDLTLRRSGTQTESRKVLPPDVLDVVSVYRVDQIKELEVKHDGAEVIYDTSKAAEKDLSSSYLVCRVKIKSGAAAESGEGGAKGSILFTPAQFRLVGPRPDATGRGNAPKVFPAVGMSDIYIPPPYDRGNGASMLTVSAEDAAVLVKFALDTPLVLNDQRHKALIKGSDYVIDVVFEVPSDTFEPWYVEFKNGARKEIPAKMKITRQAEKPKAAAAAESDESDKSESDEADDSSDADKDDSDKTSASTDSDKPGKGKEKSGKGKVDKNPRGKVVVGEQPKGRVGLVGAKEEGTGVFDDLPVVFAKDNQAVASKSHGDKFHDGHFYVELPKEPIEASEGISKFDVPAGKKLVQLNVDRFFAGSMYGSALAYARSVLAQYYLETQDGTKFWAKGMYIKGTLNGKQVIELQYWYEPDVEERCLEEFNTLKPNILKMNPGNFEFSYLFVVDPGVKIVRFHTSAKNAQDCTIEVPN